MSATTIPPSSNLTFNLVVQSLGITINSPTNDTFTFSQAGIYVIVFQASTNMQQITAVLTDSGGVNASSFILSSPSTDVVNKGYTYIINVAEPGTTLTFVNSLGNGNFLEADLVIFKIA